MLLRATLLLLLLFYHMKGFQPFRGSGIPFNYPDTNYCATCNIDAVNFGTPRGSEIIDEACQYFLHRQVEGKDNLKDGLQALYMGIAAPYPTRVWIFVAFVNAKFQYESIFYRPYTYRIFIEPDHNKYADNCIHIYSEGKGFATLTVPEMMLNRGYGKQIAMGTGFENIWVNGIRDLWAVSKCHPDIHSAFVLGAKKRIHKYSQYYSDHAVLPTTSHSEKWPVYESSDLPTCPANGPNNNTQYLSDKPHCSTMYCFSPKKARVENQDTGATEEPENSQEVNSNRPGGLPATADRSRVSKEVMFVVVINEFMSHRDISNRDEILELKLWRSEYYKNEITLKGYKIIIFSALTLKCYVIINLNEEKFNEHGYFVITKNMVPNLKNVQVAQIDGLNHKLVPNGDNEPFVIALLYRPYKNDKIQTSAWSSIELPGRRSKKGRTLLDLQLFVKNGDEKIQLIEIVKETIVDSQVYGIPQNSQITILKQLSKSYENACNFVLGQGDPKNSAEDNLSQNFCPKSMQLPPATFSFSFYKLGLPTPGMDNDCLQTRGYEVDKTKHAESTTAFTVGLTNYPINAMECPTPDSTISSIFSAIETEIAFIREAYRSDYSNKYYKYEFVQRGWKKIVENGLTLDRLKTEDIFPFEIVEQKLLIPGNTNIRCKLCHDRVKWCSHTVPSRSLKSSILQENGYSLGTRSKQTVQKVLGHLESEFHLNSILQNIRNDRKKFEADRRIHSMAPAKEELETLANVMRTIWTMIWTNTAPSNSQRWLQLVSVAGGKVGIHLRTRNSAFKIIRFIAKEAFSTMVKYLVESDFPFSLIMDASSDKQSNHYVLIYIQTQEGTYSITYFFRMIKFGKSATAEAYVNAVKTAIQSAGPEFEKYFFKRITAVITDSENTMQKAHELISKWVGKTNEEGAKINLIKILCLAHKIQLSSRSTLIPLKRDKDHGPNDCLKYFEIVEKFLQSLYTWIATASRRMGEVREVISEFNLPRIELTYLYKERWISSEHNTLKHYLSSIKTNSITMNRIKEDTDNYSADVRAKAVEFRNKILDKRQQIIIVFLQDFTAAFKAWSLKIQQFAGVLSDHHDNFLKLKADLDVLGELEGPVLKSFLTSCTCSAAAQPQTQGCTVDEYENSQIVNWNGLEFKEYDVTVPLLSVLGPATAKKAKERLNNYVDDRLMIATKIFNPKHFVPSIEVLNTQFPFVSDIDQTPIYGNGNLELDTLCELLGLNAIEIKSEWARLIKSLLESPSWFTYRSEKETDKFWSRLLSDTNLPWTKNLELLIRSVKTLTPGSTAPESGFSVFNVLKNNKRTRISDDNLESIMLILLNGPNDLDYFDAYKYAQLWISSGNNTPDDPVPMDTCNTEIPDPDDTNDVLETDPGDVGVKFDIDPTESNQEEQDEDIVFRPNPLPRFRSVLL